jgi:type VI secretion system protein ImpA
MKISKKRINIDDEKLLAPLPTSDGVGESLRYDSVYDQIREARREEDDKLSQGIWQRDLKKADFVAVEQLCANALEFRSKDLQIVAWLVESWTALDGLEGFYRGVQLCHRINNIYWGNIYPQQEDNDFEARLRLFEWMNDQFANRLLMVSLTHHPLSQEMATLTLADWLSALNTETVAKRSSDYAKTIGEAESTGTITLSSFKKMLQTTEAHFLQKNFFFAQKAAIETQEFYEFLSHKIGKQATSFKRIRTCLDDIERICKTTIQQRSLPLDYDKNALEEIEISVPETFVRSENNLHTDDIATLLTATVAPVARQGLEPVMPDDVMNITGRREAYQALRDIGHFLQNLDPHSPTPSLLEMIVSWENKTLPLILEDLSNAPSNTQMLLRMLESSLPKNYAKNSGSHS